MKLKESLIIGVILLVVVVEVFFMNRIQETTPAVEQVKTNATSTAVADTQVSAKVDTAKTNTKINTTKTMTQVTELIIEDKVVGTGAVATAGDNVTVNYVGSLMNGTIFDASKNHGDTGFTFSLGAGQVIKGWDLGVAGMKVGGKRKLTIPSAMAYGNQAVGGVIPANSDLIFEVELLSTGK